MGCIGVYRLVQREVGFVVVVSKVQCRIGFGKRMCETGNEFLEIALALRSSDWRSGAVIVVEGLDKSIK